MIKNMKRSERRFNERRVMARRLSVIAPGLSHVSEIEESDRVAVLRFLKSKGQSEPPKYDRKTPEEKIVEISTSEQLLEIKIAA